MSDWFERLHAACQDDRQAVVAAKIGYSPTALSQVLNGKYPGDLRAVERAVRENLPSKKVACPVLGEISRTACLRNQAKPFSAANRRAVQLYTACRKGCQHSNLTIQPTGE